MDKFLYISTEYNQKYIGTKTEQHTATVTVIKSFNNIKKLKDFVENVQLTIQPLHELGKLSYSSNNILSYNYDAHDFINMLTKEDAPHTNWYSYSCYTLDGRTQIYYSIYTKEQFERSKQNLLQHKI